MPSTTDFMPITDLLPLLSSRGQIFKFDRDDRDSMLIGKIPGVDADATDPVDDAKVEAWLKKIPNEKFLGQKIHIGTDEGAQIYVKAGANKFYEITFEWVENYKPPPNITYEVHKDYGHVAIDGLPEEYTSQGGWMARSGIRNHAPFIMIPRLGLKTNGAIFQ